MTISRKALCAVYGLIALLALVGTWGNNVAYLLRGFVGANTAFWRETLVNPASRSTVPIFLINRERLLAKREPSSSAGTLGVFDIAGLAAVTVAIVAYTLVTLR